jgi:hypothetical protein
MKKVRLDMLSRLAVVLDVTALMIARNNPCFFDAILFIYL